MHNADGCIMLSMCRQLREPEQPERNNWTIGARADQDVGLALMVAA